MAITPQLLMAQLAVLAEVDPQHTADLEPLEHQDRATRGRTHLWQERFTKAEAEAVPVVLGCMDNLQDMVEMEQQVRLRGHQ